MTGRVRRPFIAIALAALTACAAALLVAPQARAGYPGQLGVIALNTDYPAGLGDQEIATMPVTGGPPFTQLTFDVLGNPGNDNDPAYSGDGKRIVWESDFPPTPTDEIFIMNSDGSGQTRLTFNDTPDDDGALSWDGKRIVFERFDGDDREIWIMNADGSDQRQLTNNDTEDNDPVFSRDGTRIYWDGSDPAFNTELWTMNADGSGQRQLTFSGGAFSENADVSPDDRRVFFESDRADPVNFTSDVWAMNPDGSGQTKITSLPTFSSIGRLAVSPDGRRIVMDLFLGNSSKEEIFVVNVDGSGLAPLTATPGDVSFGSPDWQPIPVFCGGQMSTLVGTDGPDTIAGTAAKDVIAGLGGKDTLSGLQGKDLLCGGKGKDTLNGGSGNDKLFGQAGKDKLKAGKGKKDSCSGGKDKDKATGCEKEKKIP